MSVAEDLLRNTENLAVVVGDVLMVTAANNTGNNSKTIMRENLGDSLMRHISILQYYRALNSGLLYILKLLRTIYS